MRLMPNDSSGAAKVIRLSGVLRRDGNGQEASTVVPLSHREFLVRASFGSQVGIGCGFTPNPYLVDEIVRHALGSQTLTLWLRSPLEDGGR
jgi:hypothetical protein